MGKVSEKQKAASRKWREANREKDAAAQRRRYAANPEVERQRTGAYLRAHPDRNRAYTAVSKALSRGDLAREPCLFCDDPRTQAHHHDYKLPLVVTWLCPRHHRLVHRAADGSH